MKNNRGFLLAVTILLSFLMVGTAWATPISLTEVFLGGRSDANYFAMAERSIANNVLGTGNRARFNFDLTGSGGDGQLLRGNNPIGSAVGPTRDETAFDPFAYSTPYLARVDFFISDWQSEFVDPSRERVRINIESGSVTRTRTFLLDPEDLGSRRVRVDLAAEGMLDLLTDGHLLAMAIAPAFSDVYNTFNLDRVVLYAEAAPVPEPATMILLGSGLVGMAITGRRRMRKK